MFWGLSMKCSLFLGLFLERWGITSYPRSSRPPVRWLCIRINSGTHIEHKQVILFLLPQLPLHPVHAPVIEVVVLLPVEPRLLALLLLENVTSTNVLVPQQITVVLPAISREPPEPMGEGGIKQSARRRLSHIFSYKSRFPCGYRSFPFCFSPPFFSCSFWTSSPNGWWQSS